MQSTHVEVIFNLPRDEGSTPSASTYHAGSVFKPPCFFSALRDFSVIDAAIAITVSDRSRQDQHPARQPVSPPSGGTG